MERNNQNQKRIISFFKQFVNTTLLKHFKASEETLTQWNYFSSLLSQQNIDMDKIQLYLQVLSPKQELYSPSKLQLHSKIKTEENQKTNSGIYGKKNDSIAEIQKLDFQPNRTVGGNLDKAKYTGMVGQKSNPYTFDSKQKKKGGVERNDGKTGGIMALIEGMQVLNNGMLDNHLALEKKSDGLNLNSIQIVSSNSNSSYNSSAGSNSSNNLYRYRGEQRHPS